MKSTFKHIALVMAFIMLMTSCYTGRVDLSKNRKDELREFISKLEPGKKIKIIDEKSQKFNLVYLELKNDTLMGAELSEGVPYFIPIDSIEKIKTPDHVKTVVLLGTICIVGMMVFFLLTFDEGIPISHYGP